MRPGARSPDVARLQSLLIDKGAALTADGSFGPKTSAAVRSFQAAAHLVADGVVGPKTWSALEGSSAAPADTGAQKLAEANDVSVKLEAVTALLRQRRKQAEWQAVPTVPQRAARQVRAAAGDGPMGFLDDLGDLPTTVGEVVGGVTSTVEGLVRDVTSTVEGLVGGVTSTVEDVGGAAGAWVQQAGGKVVEAATGLQNELATVGQDVRRRFGGQLEVVEQLVRELGRGLRADVDLLGILNELNRLLALGAATNAVKPSELPEGCKLEVVTSGPTEMGCNPGKCGTIMEFKYTRVKVNGGCSFEFPAAMDERVTSDGSCIGAEPVKQGSCPMTTDGNLGGCNDNYGFCRPSSVLFPPKSKAKSCEQTMEQQLIVAGETIESHTIKFTVNKEDCGVVGFNRV